MHIVVVDKYRNEVGVSTGREYCNVGRYRRSDACSTVGDACSTVGDAWGTG